MEMTNADDAVIAQTSDTAMTAPTEKATGAQKDAALADAALACVRWNESVDVGRLLLLEHEHDIGLLGRIVAGAGTCLDDYEECRSFDFINDTRAMVLGGFFVDYESQHTDSVYVHRHDGAVWSIGTDFDRRLTDAQVTSWLALCARHCLFAIDYDVATTEDADSEHPDRDGNNTGQDDHGTTWLASVARGLTGRSGAWTGVEVMRTRNLCLVLLAILDARANGGPLAVVELPGGSKVDQGVTPSPADHREGDDALIASIGDALAQVERVSWSTHGFFLGRADECLTGPAGHTRQVLSAVCTAVDRLYATEPFYLGVIAPAEYEAMVANGPLGAAFFH
jgi:hypothetical protein